MDKALFLKNLLLLLALGTTFASFSMEDKSEQSSRLSREDLKLFITNILDMDTLDPFQAEISQIKSTIEQLPSKEVDYRNVDACNAIVAEYLAQMRKIKDLLWKVKDMQENNKQKLVTFIDAALDAYSKAHTQKTLVYESLLKHNPTLHSRLYKYALIEPAIEKSIQSYIDKQLGKGTITISHAFATMRNFEEATLKSPDSYKKRKHTR
jgi:hypothetical protein